MIQTYNQTPHSFSQKSRDFQLFGHIYDFVFNQTKNSLSSILNNYDAKNIDGKLLPLLATTLGFNVKHKYIDNDLRNILGSFKYILKSKGTISSIEYAINILVNSQGFKSNVGIVLDNENHIVDIYTANVKDVIILEDLLDYILPAGYNYCIYTSSLIKQRIGDDSIEVGINNNLDSEGTKAVTDLDIDKIQASNKPLPIINLNTVYGSDTRPIN